MNVEEKELPGKGRKKIAIAVAILLALVIIPLTYFYAVEAPPKGKDVSVVIPKDATGRQIASILKENGVIKNELLFKWVAYITGAQKRLHSGHFRMKSGLTVQEALYEVQHAREEYVVVTIPEGYTVRQMGLLLEKEGVCKADDFIAEATNYGPLTYMYGPEAALVKGEGFLFADTYDIPKSYTVRDICDMMYKRTDSVLTERMREQAEKKGMTLHAVMTVASLVEREAQKPEEAEPIASVILTRLEKDIPLQVDATIQYILGEQKKELTIADTQIPSPYNTYLRKGLPPGPIASPGKVAIEAVLSASPGAYLYYVAKKDGTHVFTKTLEEHQAATVAIYGSTS